MSSLTVNSSRATQFRVLGPRQIGEIAERYGLAPELRQQVEMISQVLPFRVNDYVLSELIDWSLVPDDPVFQLVFPQSGMLAAGDEKRLLEASRIPGGTQGLRETVRDIRAGLNPHPSGQMELNVPTHEGVRLRGVQHKYRETVLYFPSSGQTCHTYCTYCFRWAQFIGDPELRFAAPDPVKLVGYLLQHPETSDVLITGGDPMVMSTERLRGHIEPLLAVESVRTIRIGTKSGAYWPQRFVTDPDSDDLMRLFEQIVASGRTLALMAHFSHPRELSTDIARRAVSRIRATGATVYCQAPMIAHVNDSASVWNELWRAELAVGAVPYYLFVERDTGPHEYFKVPLADAVAIFQAAYRRLPGLARTVRGPVMSTTAGKVLVDGIEETAQGRWFQLRLAQARDPALVGRPFRARYSPTASWLDELELDAANPADIRRALDNALRFRAADADAS